MFKRFLTTAAVALALSLPSGNVRGEKENPLAHRHKYLQYKVPISKLRKAPPWWGLWSIYNANNVFEVIKPFKYEKSVEKRLRMPKSVRWEWDEYKERKHMFKVDSIIEKQTKKLKPLNAWDYLDKNPPKVYNVPKYDYTEIALLRKAGLYETLDFLDQANEIIETGTLKRDTAVVVLTRNVYRYKDKNDVLVAVYASEGIDVKVMPKKDTTIFIRELGEVNAIKYTLLITYDTLNPWVYYNSPLGLIYRLRWHKHKMAPQAWARENWLDYLRVIASFSGYVEACHHRDEIIAWRDSLEREILKTDSLLDVVERELEKYKKDDQKRRELLVEKNSLSWSKEDNEEQLKAIKGLLKYRITEEKCKDYLSEEYMRYFTRGGVISIMYKRSYFPLTKDFIEGWNNESYWKKMVPLKPRVIDLSNPFHLTLYGAFRQTLMTTTAQDKDTIIIYMLKGEKVHKFIFENHISF